MCPSISYNFGPNSEIISRRELDDRIYKFGFSLINILKLISLFYYAYQTKKGDCTKINFTMRYKYL